VDGVEAMLTTMQIMSAAGVVAYFGRELSTSEYYTTEHGVWYGKGAERLGLPSDLTRISWRLQIIGYRNPGIG
jgi:hypothetical protein